MKKISRISGALLISMLFSSILSGVVLVIMGTLNLPLDMQSIKVICGSIASVGYFYFFRLFTKEIGKININEISLNKKFSVWDDDKNICELLRLYLVKEGYGVTIANDGTAALQEFDKLHPDLVLLDVMMPGIDGWEVCRKIRQNNQTPIIMLTAKGETYDKVLGLELGADDYIVKPFETKEVTARIKAVLRRCGSKDEENKGVYDFDNLHLDMNRYELKVKGKVVDAPPKELELLACLAGHPNRVYTRDQLLDEVWGFEYYGDSRTIDVHVKRLREKLEGASEQWNLKTVWGVGYKFEVKE